jgi:hypothetical protein
MRTLRATAVAVVVVGTLALPSGASADGGAYIDFGGGTHYLAGDPATGTAFVAVPSSRQGLLDRGPFSTFLLTGGAWLQEGRPIPDGAIRVGTVAIERVQGRSFRLTVPVTVPDLPGGFYDVAVCNVPCTIAGFREPLVGTISIVETEREGELLTDNSKLWSRTYHFRSRARKVEKANEELATQLEQSRIAVGELTSEVDRLETALEVASRPVVLPPAAADPDRPLAESWPLFGIAIAVVAAALAIGLALVFSRRSASRSDAIGGAPASPRTVPTG